MNDYSDAKKKNLKKKNSKKKKSSKKTAAETSILEDALTDSNASSSKKENASTIKNYLESDYNEFKSKPEHKPNNSNKFNYIISTLKSDYRKVSSSYSSFKKLQKKNIDAKKLNLKLNSIESSLYNSYKNLNNISKTTDSNDIIKSALDTVFNYDDIVTQSILYAYNIYSLVKIFHYNKNNKYKKNARHNKFKKHNFDTLKSTRDESISSLQSQPSLKLSENQKLNLKLLRKERIDMEGLKSGLRLKVLSASRNKELNYNISKSKFNLDNKIFNSKLNYLEILAKKSSLSAFNSGNFKS